MNQIKYHFLTLVLSVLTLNISADTYNYDELESRVLVDIWSNGDGGGSTWVAQQNANGSWSDLQYGASTKATTAKNHLIRLYDIAQVCTDSSKDKYNNVEYVEALKSGLNYWYNNKAVDTNWWYNEIYYPQRLGEIMLMMRNLNNPLPIYSDTEICEEELLSLFYPTGKSKILSHGTGANAVDIAQHYLYRGLLTTDSVVLQSIPETLEPTLLNNIAADLTYQDHGPQLQTSSYGYVFCKALFTQAYYLTGSPAAFDIESEKFSTLLDFVRKVQVPSIRGNHWDFSAVGRGISRPNNTRGSLGYLKLLASHIDTTNAVFYNNALLRHTQSKSASYDIEEFNRHYWESDYTQHAREEYLFTVRSVSNRTVESETGNNESLKANYFSYGATLIAVDGDEYYNIMPVWDWSMIPGITMKHTSTFPARSKWGSNYGNSTFVGGVSNGTYGNSVLSMNKNGVKAQKSWFFFDDEIVCLGSNISGTDVRTTVDQCLFQGPSSYLCEGEVTPSSKSIGSSDNNPDNLSWIRHGKVGYFFPENGNVKFSMKSQKGSWYDINNTYSQTELSEYVFKLWFDHGTSTAANYAYIVAPNMVSDAEAQAYNASKIQILQNDGDIQAVYHSELNLVQVVFYKAGDLSFGGRKISVNKPCTLLFDGTNVSVADPNQLQTIIVVTIDQDGQSYKEVISMPSSENKGKSITVDFKLPSALSDAPVVKSFNIYPNPASTVLNVELNDNNLGVYQIVNLQGTSLIQGECLKSTVIDVSGLSRGCYFLSVKNDAQQTDTVQFMKE